MKIFKKIKTYFGEIILLIGSWIFSYNLPIVFIDNFRHSGIPCIGTGCLDGPSALTLTAIGTVSIVLGILIIINKKRGK
jgi:hypothetical protein